MKQPVEVAQLIKFAVSVLLPINGFQRVEIKEHIVRYEATCFAGAKGLGVDRSEAMAQSRANLEVAQSIDAAGFNP
ncbi:hypothetical protein D3C86_1685500 [compost metagenome]